MTELQWLNDEVSPRGRLVRPCAAWMTDEGQSWEAK